MTRQHRVVLTDRQPIIKTAAGPRFSQKIKQPVYRCMRDGMKVEHRYNGKFATGNRCEQCGAELHLTDAAKVYE